MPDEPSKLTLASVAQRRDAAKLLFADGRYVTRGAPRSGGLASVYKAVDTDTGDTVAIKVFRSGGPTDDVVEESFRREVQALSDLKHSSIVRILGSGRDDEHSAHYIVMEWIEKDLTEICTAKKFDTWDAFYTSVGSAILDALIFAHSSSTVHRDIKPSNILITDKGEPKLCDFGISKIRSFLAPGVTLAHFASAPFSPPEQDDGTYSYSRDVFGFAALGLSTVVSAPLANHGDLISALDGAPMSENIRALLRRCLSINPEMRPENAIRLHGEIRACFPATSAPTKRPAIAIGVTNRVRDLIYADLGISSTGVEQFVETDLDGCFCEEIAPPADRPGRSFRLYGHAYGYTASADIGSGRLVLVDALEFSASDMERRRSFACPIGFRPSVSQPDLDVAEDGLDRFFDEMAAFAADQKLRRLEQREQALYRTWLDLLGAKTALEKQHKVRVRYETHEPATGFVRFTLREGEDASRLADRDVTISDGHFVTFRGTVINTAGTGIVLVRPSELHDSSTELPESGALDVDTTRVDLALDKQKAALEAVRYGKSINPELGRLIVNPASVEAPPAPQIEFIQAHIDDDKKEAVAAALGGPALMVVEGPPGTGKTTFITELVLQTLRANPNARVLLTSQTHVALDNSLERIIALSPETRALRIGNENDDRISRSTRKLLLDQQIPTMRESAIASGARYVEKWAVESKLNLKDLRRAMSLERHASLRQHLDSLDDQLKTLAPQLGTEGGKELADTERAALEEEFQGLRRERDEIERAAKESLKELGQHCTKDELKDYGNCSAADLREWADAYTDKTAAGTQLRKMLLAHAAWEARFGRSRDFMAALVASAQVVAGTCIGVMGVPGKADISYDLCIVDEASIATPTEVLVPMSRARRTVLVGDRRQLSPFQDPELQSSGLLEQFGLTAADQKETLFNHLCDTLPRALHKVLSTQHRMVKPIGDMISECFYGKALHSVARDPRPSLAPALPRPVTWYSTSRVGRRKSRKVGTSCYNDYEVSETVKILGRMDFLIRNGKKEKNKPKPTLAVLTGYSEQKERLRTAIETRRHEWVSYGEIMINVVDAFQGREADITLFSITRSEERTLGFLREMERINVALSRAKELLIILGDHAYCQMDSSATNPLRDVVDYMRANPATCALEEVRE